MLNIANHYDHVLYSSLRYYYLIAYPFNFCTVRR